MVCPWNLALKFSLGLAKCLQVAQQLREPDQVPILSAPQPRNRGWAHPFQDLKVPTTGGQALATPALPWMWVTC